VNETNQSLSTVTDKEEVEKSRHQDVVFEASNLDVD
jgi:hypothetical protein